MKLILERNVRRYQGSIEEGQNNTMAEQLIHDLPVIIKYIPFLLILLIPSPHIRDVAQNDITLHNLHHSI
jgi:hypothetical protein